MSAALATRLAKGEVLHLRSNVRHARRGKLGHSFSYGVDYLLFSPQNMCGLLLFSRNRLNLASYHDIDHGGVRGQGQGAAWAAQAFAQAGLPEHPDQVIALLTQPRFLGHWFTPISLWLALQGDDLLAVIAEVNNTFGHRHSYLCHRPGFAPIGPQDMMTAQKLMHVSPFQDVAGHYEFRFDLRTDHAAVHISQVDGDAGLDAMMAGPMARLGNAGLLGASLRRPAGSLRVLALIYWNALRLKLKGAAYRRPPPPPDQEIS